MKLPISILGSTGSIGKQTLDVVSAFPSSFKVCAIAAKDEIDEIIEQIKKFNPSLVSVVSDSVKAKLEEKLQGAKVKILVGSEGLMAVATCPEAKLVVVAIPGALTLVPALEAVKLGKNIALATKEILVAGGDIFMKEVKAAKVKVYPVDSEHSAVWQCLMGEKPEKIKKIILTASGGPFLKTPPEKLGQMTAKDALVHPTWKMGPKITIDCATLMNKGFEVIEAHHLFQIDYSQIEVVVHPQSIIHSMVEYVDGSIKAQLSSPDMRLPIQLALFGMERSANLLSKLDLTKVGALTFEKPNRENFPCLEFAFSAGRRGGTVPAVLNAANEEVVRLFLKGKIAFSDIAVKIREAMDKHQNIENPSLNDILEAERQTKALFAA